MASGPRGAADGGGVVVGGGDGGDGEEQQEEGEALSAAALETTCSLTRSVSRGCPTTMEATPAPRPARKSLVAGESFGAGEVEEEEEEVAVVIVGSIVDALAADASSSSSTLSCFLLFQDRKREGGKKRPCMCSAAGPRRSTQGERAICSKASGDGGEGKCKE